MKLYFFFYDDWVLPKKITGFFVANSPNDIQYFNVGNADYFDETPFYRFKTISTSHLREYLLPTVTWVIHAKNLYKVYPHLLNNEATLKDPLYYLHTNDMELPQLFHAKNISTKIALYRPIIKKVYEDMTCIENSLDSYSFGDIIRATSKLDNHLFMGDKHTPTFFTPFTKSMRLKDELSASINLTKEQRSDMYTQGIVINVDFDGAHLRILDKLSGEKQIIPNKERAVDYITKTSTDVRVFKTDIYATMYSEKFDRINHPLFKRIKKTYKSYRSPFGVKNIPFNYVIQHYEVKMICDLILTIDNTVLEYYLYHYDGLTFSIHPEKYTDFMKAIKEFGVKHPLKLTILNKTYYVN